MTRIVGTHLLCAITVCVVFLSLSATAQQKKRVPASEELPTGMSITPLAARGSTLQPLNPGLPDLPDFTVDHPISTAVSPDGSTLLILTSGYNRNNDARAKAIPAQTSEYIFVFDIQRQSRCNGRRCAFPMHTSAWRGRPMARIFMLAAAKTTMSMFSSSKMAIGARRKNQ